jgi:thiopurine S-methyltransferase
MIHQENKSVCFVLSLQPLTSDIKLITLTVEKGTISFQAGQFIGVYDGSDVSEDEKSFPGTFSIASRPSELPIIRFAIGADNNPRNMRHKMYYHTKPGDYFLLDSVGSGTVAITPNMVMTPVGGPGGIMLIGGGSAVMGLVSIVEELLHDVEGRKIPSIKLFHSNRSNKDIPFYDRLQDLNRLHDKFHYFPFSIADGECARGQLGRITLTNLAEALPGIRLFCVCGSGIFCEAIVNMLLELGVWPGSIRTDYTTRIDPARRLKNLEGKPNGSQSNRFEACADATKEKGVMTSPSNYIKTYGIDTLLELICNKLAIEEPEHPLDFLSKEIINAKERLPEITNVNAGDPDFWINYWETDNVTWQAPIVSPWLEKHLDKFLGKKKKRKIFVPLCGKSLDMKLLLDLGHRVVGADCSGIACIDFFTENKIPGYFSEELTNEKGVKIIRHRSSCLPITLYEGNIFDLTPDVVGPIDRILDRAALVALPPSIIEDQYLPLLTRLLKPGGKVLFASVSELPFPKAPPHAYKSTQIEGILKRFFSKINLLEVHRYRVNAGYVSEPIYILKSKKLEKSKRQTSIR